MLISIVNHCTFDYAFKSWFETQQFSALFVHQSVVCQKVFITTAMTMETFDTGHESQTMILICFSNTERIRARVSVQGGHLACLCREFKFYEVKKKLLLFFKNMFIPEYPFCI